MFYYYLFYVIGLVMGVILGLIFIVGTRTHGILEIDDSMPEKDKYLFIITIPFDQIGKKRYLFIRVKRKKPEA